MDTPQNRSNAPDDENQNERLIEKLNELPKKTRRKKRKDTLQDKVIQWYPILKEAHDKGYTYEELVDFIQDEMGISIAAGTLRKYMAFAKRQQSEGQEVVRQKQKKTTQTPSSPPTSIVASQQPKRKISSQRFASLTGERSESEATEAEYENL